jgi:hypothetical protein
MVFNIVIVSVLVILIIHYSIDYLKTFLNPSPPILEDLKYKKYKAMIDEISRPRPDGNGLTNDIGLVVDELDKALSDDIGLGNTLSVGDLGNTLSVGDLGNTLSVGTDLFSEDLGQYFNSKIAEE